MRNNSMKILINFILLVIISSCISKNDLEGMWIGSYTEWHGTTEADKIIIQNHLIANFKNDAFTFFDIRDDFSEVRNGQFKLTLNEIKLNNNKQAAAKILYAKKDSLVWESSLEKNTIEVFKRVPEMLKYRNNIDIELEGNIYLLNYESSTDTLFFKKNKMVEWTKNKLKTEVRYRIGKMNGFYILVLHDFHEIPLFITDFEDGNIKLQALLGKTKDWQLVALRN